MNPHVRHIWNSKKPVEAKWFLLIIFEEQNKKSTHFSYKSATNPLKYNSLFIQTFMIWQRFD